MAIHHYYNVRKQQFKIVSVRMSQRVSHIVTFIIYCPAVLSRAELCGYSACNTVCSSGKLMYIRDFIYMGWVAQLV